MERDENLKALRYLENYYERIEEKLEIVDKTQKEYEEAGGGIGIDFFDGQRSALQYLQKHLRVDIVYISEEIKEYLI